LIIREGKSDRRAANRVLPAGLFSSGAFISLECRSGAALLPEACHEEG